MRREMESKDLAKAGRPQLLSIALGVLGYTEKKYVVQSLSSLLSYPSWLPEHLTKWPKRQWIVVVVIHDFHPTLLGEPSRTFDS